MICDHYTLECDRHTCSHKLHHDRTDMCGRGDSCICTHINQKVNCLAETEQERFQDWWADTYHGKLGQTIMELAFKELALKTWEARAAQNEFVARFLSEQRGMAKVLPIK